MEDLSKVIKELEQELIEVYRKLGYAKEEIKRLQEIINQRR